MAKNIKACLSHNSDEWYTPIDLFEKLDDKKKFKIIVDKLFLYDLYY